MKILFFKIIQNVKFSYFTLIIGLLLTLFAVIYTKNDIDSIENKEFITVTNEIKSNVNILIKRCTQLVITGVAFFDASREISRSEWKIFTNGLAVEKGLLGLGHTIIIKKSELKSHEQHIRNEGFPNYHVWPIGQRELYTAIIYLEPFSGRNLRAFGYDMFSEPIRVEAMSRARDTGMAALSGKVTLVQETTKNVQAGTLMYMPIYEKGQPHSTIEERRKSIIGWVYSPYRMNDMLSNIMVHNLFNKDKLQLKVYDGEKIISKNILFESKSFSGKIRFTRVVPLKVNNRMWTLVFLQYSDPLIGTPYMRVFGILLMGSFVSVLLFFLIQSLLTTQEHIVSMAEKLSIDLKKSEKKATLASKAKSEFLANMSHEIRTPINGILSMASLLNTSELTDEQAKYANLIYSSAENLNFLVSSILDYSKIEAGKLEMELIDFDFQVFLERLRTLYGIQSTKKGLTLIVLVDPKIPEVLKGDEKRLEQILGNYISNAIKFTEKGNITLEISIESNSQNEISLEFGVRDTGIGIQKENADELFQVFTQVDSSISRKYGGSGLGLAISKQLATLMGGTVGFESEANKGSYFWLKVTFHKSMINPANIAKQDISTTDKKLSIPENTKILVAEDNETNQEVMILLLNKLGIQADIVSNGKDALAKIKDTDYDLILMDIQMPVMDGIEATKRIRQSKESYKNIIIIAITADAFKENLTNYLNTGLNDYITKPINYEALVNILHKWLTTSNAAFTKTKLVPELNASIFDEADLLNRLEGDREIAKKVMNIFLANTQEKILALKKFNHEKDFKNIQLLAHSIKGSAANVAALEMKELASKIEQLSQKNQNADIGLLIEDLLQAFSNVQKVIIKQDRTE